MPRSTTLTAAAFTALAACAIAAPAASQVTTAGGEVVSTAQKHLIDNLITIDSIQAATAKLAAMQDGEPLRRKNSPTRSPPTMPHTPADCKRSPTRRTSGARPIPAIRSLTEFAKRYSALDATPAGPEFDRTFLKTVVANHQAEISTINDRKGRRERRRLEEGSQPNAQRTSEPSREGERVGGDARQARRGEAAAVSPRSTRAPGSELSTWSR